MADTRTLVAGLEYKIRQLIGENIQLKTSVQLQHEELDKLKERLEVVEKINLELTEQLNKKIIADAFNSEQEIEEGRKRIQVLMREIEQCITLVNK
ncbi:MAG TPA: hypothetical protein PK939_00345 [Bacteroidales bacterium]|nr:hypothetical protein [Bacteroidales bacterium]